MQCITVAGPPSSGKTSVLLRVSGILAGRGERLGVVKFDCLSSRDRETFEQAGIPAVVGLSGALCPDHFFVCNAADAAAWGRRQELSVLAIESAGLCNRCAPHIEGVLAVCVVDNLSGIDTPAKIGPMDGPVEFPADDVGRGAAANDLGARKFGQPLGEFPVPAGGIGRSRQDDRPARIPEIDDRRRHETSTGLPEGRQGVFRLKSAWL